MEVFIARQPIFDLKHNVFAYELLYRKSEINFFDQSVGSDVATSILIMNSYYTFGINNLVGDGMAFINFDKHLIESEIPMLLDSKKIVVELLEDIVPTGRFLTKVAKLKENGYTIAIDDYVESYMHDDLVELSDIIKIDFLANSEAEIIRVVDRWKPKGKILLAEKVETQEIFEWAKNLGFHLFQGYYFSKPILMKGKGVKTSPFQYIKVLQELGELEPDYKKISGIIETDVSLTYKLLKLVNSKFSSIKKITSIHHALTILGIDSFRKWFSLAMVQTLSQEKPSELLKVSMTRAKFMESLAINSELKPFANQAMLIGLLSSIDGLLEKPMDLVLNELPLSEDVKSTLLLLPSRFSKIYALVLLFEKGEFEKALLLNQTNCLCSIAIADYYYEAVHWAEELFLLMQEQ